MTNTELQVKHTPAPWFADDNGMIWRRHPSELYQNGGITAGDRPIATAHIGWVGEDLTGYPVNANARLIAAAPETAAERDKLKSINAELLEALQNIVIDYTPKDGSDQRALESAKQAIAKAEGKA